MRQRSIVFLFLVVTSVLFVRKSMAANTTTSTTSPTTRSIAASLTSEVPGLAGSHQRTGLAGVDTIASLRSISGSVTGDAVAVFGYHSPGDGGGGPVRYWNANSTAPDNGGTIIRPTAVSGPGRWIAEATDRLDVRWFGTKTDKADAETTTAAFRAAIDAAGEQDTVYAPPGKYFLNDTVRVGSVNDKLQKRIDFICEGSIVYCGPRDRPVLHFYRQRAVRIYIYKIMDQFEQTFHGWASDDYIGVLLENMYFCREITIPYISNFTVGLQLKTSGDWPNGQAIGTYFFNNINLQILQDCRIFIEIFKKDPNTWFNSNTINDPAFRYTEGNAQSGWTGFQTANVDRYAIKQTFVDNVIPCDSNIVRNARFELTGTYAGTYTGIHLERAWDWKFENYRCELVPTPGKEAGIKLATLDCANGLIKGIIFDPVMESYTSAANAKVNLVNVVGFRKLGSPPNEVNYSYDYTQIYQKARGVEPNTSQILLYNDSGWSTRYRSSRPDYHYIEGLYHFAIDRTILDEAGESAEYYTASRRLGDNGVRLTNQPGIIYLQNLIRGDTFTVALDTGPTSSDVSISLKPFDSAGVLIEDNVVDVSGTRYWAVVGSNLAWKTAGGKRLGQITRQGYLTFTINMNEVKTLAILVGGDYVNGIRIFSSRSDVTVKRSLIAGRNNSRLHFLASAPVNTTVDGYYSVGDRVLKEGAVSAPFGWELRQIKGVPVWVELGSWFSAATASDIDAGIDATKFLTADALAGSNFGIRYAELELKGGSMIQPGKGMAFWNVPAAFHGMNLVSALAYCGNASSKGNPEFRIRRSRNGIDTEMLSRKLSIDAMEKSSATATIPTEIDQRGDDVQTGDMIYVDVDSSGTGTIDCRIQLGFRLP